MFLKLTFTTPEKEAAFLAATGEVSIDTVNVGLINFAIKFDGVDTIEAIGSAIPFHVKQADGTWVTEDVWNPVERIQAGEVMEPFDAPIKMLADETLDLWAQNRIANRYQPFVTNPYFAEITPQRSVEVIIMDSGINAAHQEFDGVLIKDLFHIGAYEDGTDDLGHGTAIAALVAGKTLGMNPHAFIRNVKISSKDRKPTLGELGSAFDGIMSHHMATLEVPKVLNLSWATPRSAYLDEKINALIEAGVTVIAAAGNSELNIDDVTPAGVPGVFTVAASTKDDRALYAVYGVNKKLDVFAPGEAVTVPVPTTTDSYGVNTGSSFSAAFVSGVASVLYGLRSTAPMAAEVAKSMTSDATLNALIVDARVSQSENRMLHRPDTNSMPEDNIQYLGVNVIGTEDGMFVDVRMLMPASTLEQASSDEAAYTLNYGDASIEALMDTSTVSNVGLVKIRTNVGAALEPGVLVKQMWFTVTLTCPGVKFVSPPIYYFLATPEATNSDIKPLLDELSASSSFTFLEEMDQESNYSKGIKS
jgi:hypothetical protein